MNTFGDDETFETTFTVCSVKIWMSKANANVRNPVKIYVAVSDYQSDGRDPDKRKKMNMPMLPKIRTGIKLT